jgi:hypothetical protein
MANIIIDPIEILITGKVRCDVRDQNGNTKMFQQFNNSISDDLKDSIASTMQGNASSVFITNSGSDWFTGQLYSVVTGQNGKDGIIITQTASELSWDLMLSENVQSPSISTATVTWQAEVTWTGTEGSGTATSGAIDKMQIGNSYAHASQNGWAAQQHRDHDHFDTVFASADSDESSDFTAFTLDDNDIARVSWAITIA